MMRVSYKDQTHYTFACQILAGAVRDQKLYQLDPQNQTIIVSHETLGSLLARIQSQQAVLFPYLDKAKGEAAWILTAPTLYQLEQARIHIQHLLVPAYAVFQRKVPSFRGKSDLQRLGAQLYPYGYYVLRSRPEYTNDVFRLLDLWMRLEQERPTPQEIIEFPTYGALYERFQLALAAAQWDEAEQFRREMQRRNLTSADNLHFLEIEWLARQQRWYDIWQQDDFASLARVPIPRAVRSALLTAFHRVKLLPEEQQGNWQGALEEFTEHLPQLGLLLTTRLGLSHGPVVQVFAYNATRNRNRAELQELITASNDPAALECIKQLMSFCESKSVLQVLEEPASALKLARAALVEENYDLAVHYVQRVKEAEAKLILLMQISFYTRDITLAEEALLLYWELPEQQQASIQRRYIFLPSVYGDLLQLVSPGRTEKDARDLQTASIKTWIDWFQRVLKQPNDPELLPTLANLAQTSDDRFWQPDRVIELDELLLELVANDPIVVLPYVRDAIGKLISFFLNDPAFPRTESIYQDLYDNFYAALLARQAREELHSAFLLLRLADALLNTTPGKCETILTNLRQWSGIPMTKTELWVLEAFEMLIDYGLSPQQLVAWCREWLEWLLAYAEHAHWRAWFMLCRIIQPGDDLLHQVEQKLEISSEQVAADVLGTFSAGYQIGIYSLREGAALRARELLLARNPQLEVQICTDEVLTARAKALAQNADLVVLVTTAMKHALSDGIGPFLDTKKVVHPQSCGSSSIVRAVEEHARKQQPETM
jgi:hypothetical protein